MRTVLRGVGVCSAAVVVMLGVASCGGSPQRAAAAGVTEAAPAAPEQVSVSVPAPGAVSSSGTKPGGKAPEGEAAGDPASDPAKPAPKADQGSAAAPKWKRAFTKDPAGIGCQMSFGQLRASNAPRITFGNTTVFVGFEQQGQNQDPVFARFDGKSKTYCEHHERQAPDGRAVGFTWDGGNTAYVLYTVVGGGTDFDALARNGWENRYGDGGASSKVTVIAKVELMGGEVTDATFLTAKLVRDGALKTNSIVPVAAPIRTAAGRIKVYASSAFSPLNPNHTLMCKPFAEYPSSKPGRKDKANYLGIFSPRLRALKCAETWGCTKVRKPCP